MIKRITFSADDELIRKARQRSAEEKRSLGDAFREWLSRYAAQDRNAVAFTELMRRLRYVRAGRKFSREELHERTHSGYSQKREQQSDLGARPTVRPRKSGP